MSPGPARPTVVVAHDPLCGWCYGFGPALAALRARFAERATFTVAMGGLVTGRRERMIGIDAPYLMRGLKEVHERTGVKAGPAFFERVLEPGRWVSRSEPACRAARVAREIAGPEAGLDVAMRLCAAFYGEGRLPDDPATIGRVARAAGLDAEAIVAAWSAPEAFAATMAMFEAERARGIVSYPAVHLEDARGDRIEVIGGCVPPEAAIAALDAALERVGA